MTNLFQFLDHCFDVKILFYLFASFLDILVNASIFSFSFGDLVAAEQWKIIVNKGIDGGREKPEPLRPLDRS